MFNLAMKRPIATEEGSAKKLFSTVQEAHKQIQADNQEHESVGTYRNFVKGIMEPLGLIMRREYHLLAEKGYTDLAKAIEMAPYC